MCTLHLSTSFRSGICFLYQWFRVTAHNRCSSNMQWLNEERVILEQHHNSYTVTAKYWVYIRKWRDSHSKTIKRASHRVCHKPGCTGEVKEQRRKETGSRSWIQTTTLLWKQTALSSSIDIYTKRAHRGKRVLRWTMKLGKVLQKVNLIYPSPLNKIFCLSD